MEGEYRGGRDGETRGKKRTRGRERRWEGRRGGGLRAEEGGSKEERLHGKGKESLPHVLLCVNTTQTRMIPSNQTNCLGNSLENTS